MSIDLDGNKKYNEIISSMDNISRLTLQGIMNIINSYEKQHPLCKEKFGNLFTLLLTKNIDIINENNSSQFLNNLKIVFM